MTTAKLDAAHDLSENQPNSIQPVLLTFIISDCSFIDEKQDRQQPEIDRSQDFSRSALDCSAIEAVLVEIARLSCFDASRAPRGFSVCEVEN
ncbi:MAG: hypothetical protein AAF415_03325 [Pseudomonadota bacterium]